MEDPDAGSRSQGGAVNLGELQPLFNPVTCPQSSAENHPMSDMGNFFTTAAHLPVIVA